MNTFFFFFFFGGGGGGERYVYDTCIYMRFLQFLFVLFLFVSVFYFSGHCNDCGFNMLNFF